MTLEALIALDGGGRARAAGILELIASGDAAGVLQALPVDEGQEGEVLTELLDHLRAAVLAGLCGPNVPHLQTHAPLPEERTALVELAKKIGGARAELWLTDLLSARERLRLLPALGRVILEAALLAPEPPPAAPREQRAPAPAPAPQRGQAPRKAASSAQRVRSNSAQDAWVGFLEELKGVSPSLEQVINRRGSLLKFEGARALIELRDMRDDERGQAMDRRSGRQINKAFSAAIGREVEVELQDAAATAPGTEDAFTRDVRDQFDGRIDD